MNLISGGSAVGVPSSDFVISGRTSGSRALWGTVRVENDGYVSGATVASCGRLYVVSGGAAEDVQILRNGHAIVSGGGVLTSAVLSGGINDIANVRNAPDYQLTLSGSVTSDKKGNEVISWAETSDTLIGANGTEGVMRYGLSHQTRVTAGGSQIVASSGKSLQTQLAGGSQIISKGGIADATVISSGTQVISSGGTALGTQLSAGKQIVSNGGSALGTTVNSGIQELRGGMAGGYESTIVGADKKTSSVQVYGLIASGASQVIYDGLAVGDRVFGTQIITSSGANAQAVAQSAMILSGASQIISSGGHALDCMYGEGSVLEVFSGGIIEGDFNLAEIGASAALHSGAVIDGKFITMGEVSIEKDLVFTGNDAGIYLWIDENNVDSRNGFAMLHNFNNLGENTKNCFISAAGDIADGVYTLADGAEGFSGSIGIYNDDWNTPTIYVASDGKSVTANYIEYSLTNTNGTLAVTVVNNTVYDKYLSNWSKSADGRSAETTFATIYAGRYSFENFVNASFNGRLSIVDKSGKLLVSLTVSNGRVQDDKKNNFLLEAGNYRLICEIDNPNAFKENAQAHLVDDMIFFRANMYDDNVYTNLTQPELRIDVAADESGKVAVPVSDAANYYEFVGYTDLADYRMLNVSAAGVYDLVFTKNTDLNSTAKVTLYQVSGTSLKKVASVTAKDAVDEFYVIKEKQLAAGTYYLHVESPAGAKGYGVTYGASMVGSVYNTAPEGSDSALGTNEEFDAEKGVTGQVNFASPKVFYCWEVEEAGVYELSCMADVLKSVGNNALTVTVYNVADGKTAMTQILSFSTKDAKFSQEFRSKEIFLAEGNYFISVESKQTSKGADVIWELSADCKTAYPVPESLSENRNFADAEDWTIKTKDAVTCSDIYVGYENPVQWFYLDLAGQTAAGGVFNFTISSSNESNSAASVTIYQLQPGNKLKKIKSVSVKPDTKTALNGIALSGDGEYFVMVDGCAAAKSGKFAEITVTADAQSVYSGAGSSAQSSDDQIWALDDDSVIDLGTPFTGTLGAGDSADYCKLELAHSGYYNFNLASDDKNAKLTVTLYKWNNNGSALTKVSNLTLAGMNTEAELKKELLLDAGSYYFAVECANTNKGGYGEYALTLEAGTVFDHEDILKSDNNYGSAKEVCLTYEKDKIEIVGTGEGFVGYGDDTDFILLQDVMSGTYDFRIQTSGELKFTLYKYDTKSNKLVSLSGTKNFKSGSNTLSGLHLEADVDYYIAVQAKNNKSEVIYSLTAEAETAGSIAIQYNTDTCTEIDPMKRNAMQMINFEVAPDGWLYNFDTSRLGTMELFMFNDSKGTLQQIKITAGKEVKLAEGSYYLQLEANQAINQASYLAFDAEARTFSWTTEKPDDAMLLA